MATVKFSNPQGLWPRLETCAAWRWYYRHPETGQELLSDPMTQSEIEIVDRAARPVPGSAVDLPVVLTWNRPT